MHSGIDVELNNYQDTALAKWISGNFCVDIVARQIGTTTLKAGYALWCALFKSPSTIGFISSSSSNSKAVMQKINGAIAHIPDFLKPDISAMDRCHVEFTTGSKIITFDTNMNNLRGRTFNLVLFDDAGYCKKSEYETVIHGLIPALPRTTSFIMSSSLPDDENHPFIKVWRDSEFHNGSFSTGLYPYTYNKREDKEFETRMVLTIGRDAFNREYLCK